MSLSFTYLQEAHLTVCTGLLVLFYLRHMAKTSALLSEQFYVFIVVFKLNKFHESWQLFLYNTEHKFFKKV